MMTQTPKYKINIQEKKEKKSNKDKKVGIKTKTLYSLIFGTWWVASTHLEPCYGQRLCFPLVDT